MKHMIPFIIVALVAGGPVAAVAEEPGRQTVSSGATKQVPLRIQLVVSRYSGEKKVSSIPYTLSVVANDQKTSLRMGVDVPVPTTVFTGAKDNASTPIASYNYRPVGTNIDCTATTLEPGLFKLDLAVSDTSVFLAEKTATSPSPAMTGVPAFRSFTSTFTVLLRDGQTARHTAATDPVSGEVLRIDVSLNVLK